MRVIREAREEDIPSLTELLRILFSIEKDFTFDEEKQRRGLQMLIDDERGTVLAAEQNGDIIGMCTGQLTVSTAEGGSALLVEDVVVAKEWRSQGIGRQLMDEIGKWGQQAGASRLQLLADKTNIKAIGFYMNTGWQYTQLVCLRRHQK